MQHHFDVRLPSDMSRVPALRERFEEHCVDCELEGVELEEWKVVFTELVCNAMEHGCRSPADQVLVAWQVSHEAVSVCVTDPGPYDPRLVGLFDRKVSDFSETGRGAGLILIRHYTDCVSVEPDAGGGTRVCVSRRRGGGCAQAPEVPREL